MAGGHWVHLGRGAALRQPAAVSRHHAACVARASRTRLHQWHLRSPGRTRAAHSPRSTPERMGSARPARCRLSRKHPHAGQRRVPTRYAEKPLDALGENAFSVPFRGRRRLDLRTVAEAQARQLRRQTSAGLSESPKRTAAKKLEQREGLVRKVLHPSRWLVGNDLAFGINDHADTVCPARASFFGCTVSDSHRASGVAQQRELETICLTESAVFFHGIEADAKDDGVLVGVIRTEVAKLATLDRSPRGTRLWVEPKHDVFAALLTERDGLASVVG